MGDEYGCSFHDWFPQNDGTGNFTYRPYIALDYGAISGSSSCQADGSNLLGNVSVYAGHEWAEALTDPLISYQDTAGWLGSKGEVADYCLNGSKTPITDVNGYPMQYLWSDEANGCVSGSLRSST